MTGLTPSERAALSTVEVIVKGASMALFWRLDDLLRRERMKLVDRRIDAMMAPKLRSIKGGRK